VHANLVAVKCSTSAAGQPDPRNIGPNASTGPAGALQLSAQPHCDVEIAGTRIRSGQTAALLIGGANHDPNVFPNPDRLDVTRSNAREHLAFASGTHACLGAALARIEGITALRALFHAFPDLQLTEAPRWCTLTNLRGHTRIPAVTKPKSTTLQGL
jgi:cytochrome P450